MGRILIADDHETLRRTLAQSLAENGHEVDEAPNGNAAIEKLHEGAYDVVVSDLRMGGSTGIEVLKTAKALHPSCAVVLMTAFGSVTTAVEAMKAGAFDYVQKPFEIEEMEVKVQKALELRRMQHEIDYLRHAQGGIYEFDNIIGSSGALSAVLGVVKKVAKSNTTVLVRGETGTGKELIAGAVHHNSQRNSRSFIKVNCARSGEPARVGALRPREGRLHRRRQAAHRPLRAGRRRHAVPRRNRGHEPEHPGQDPARAPGARVRAARRHPHHQGGRAPHRRHQPRPADHGGRGRLPRGPVLPPQRRHHRDAAAARAQGRHRGARQLLHQPLLRRAEEEDRRPVARALKLLMRYHWPGNIRELENAVERAMLLADGSHIQADDLRLGETGAVGTRATRSR
jgi:DNA-binding NtrC family response regulator